MKFLFLLVLVVGALSSSVIPVVPEQDVAEIYVRIGEYKEINNTPVYPFETIYKKSIYKLDDNGNERDISSVCQQTPADILFTPTFFYKLSIFQNVMKNDVITTFEEIKADRKILDTALFNDKVYLLLRGNYLLIFNSLTSQLSREFKMPSLAEKRSIEIGFFVEASSHLLVVTRYEAFVMGEYPKRLEGYENYTDFESARELFGSYFAVCGVNSGIMIYSYQGDILVKKLTLDARFFGRSTLFISDLAYNADKKQIFVSDLKFGINIVSLEESAGNIHATLVTRGYRKTGCNVMVYVDGNLYASCDDLFKVRYSTDEAIIDMPNPMFRVRQLLVYKGLVVAVGEDLITKYYNDKLAEETPEFDLTERLIFYSNNKYLQANFYGLQAGTFQIKYPAIECYTSNLSAEGIVSAVIKTQAECSAGYFTDHSMKIPPSIGQTDTCLYTSPVQLIFWKGEEFEMQIIFIIFGILFLAAAIIVIWCIFMIRKEASLKRTLEMYVNPNKVDLIAGTGIQGYNVMIEDSKETEQEISETNKELQMDKATHSID